MLIKKISLKNIRSYEDIDVEFPEGSILLSGDIGSGKTSILLAIEFALFGLQPGQRGSSLLRNGKTHASVTLYLDINGKEVIIQRSLKKTKSITQDSASIIIDGLKREMSVTELKNLVLSLLDYPTEFVKKTNLLYKFTVYTPQEEMKQIILEDAETRLDTLRHIFGIDKYKKIRENLTFLTGKLREEIRNFQGQIQDLELKKEILEEKTLKQKKLDNDVLAIAENFEEAREKREKIEREISDIEKKIKEKENLEKEIEKAKVMFAGKREILFGAKNEISEIKNQIEEVQKIKFDFSLLSKLEEKLKEIRNTIEKNNSKLIEISGAISSVNSKNKEAQAIKERIVRISQCPTCLQDVSETHKSNILLEYESKIKEAEKSKQELDKEKENLEKEKEKLTNEAEKTEKEISEINILKIKFQNLEEKKERILALEKKEVQFNKDLELLSEHILNLKNSALELSKFENFYQNKKKELDSAVYDEKTYEIKIAEMKKEIELLKKEMKLEQIEIEGKEEIKKKLSYLSELETWLSETFLSLIAFTEQNVMLKLREEFSKIFSEWFSVLVTDNLSIRLNEDFTPIIEQQGYELEYSALSGGERTAVALAYRLALNQVINSLLSRIKTRDLIILDEPTDGFSEQQLDKMRDVLQQLNVRQLILVSHEQKIEGFVNNIIRFKKEGGISRIEVV